jgi:ABC-type enterochelin transport system substrate-binding protein
MPIRVYVTYKKYKESSNSDSGSVSNSDYEVVTEIKPQTITIPNYDELTIKTGM